MMLRDKYRAIRLAQGLGIPCLHTQRLRPGQDQEWSGPRPADPLVVKPLQGSDDYGVAVVHNEQELHHQGLMARHRNQPTLIQELIPEGCAKYSVALFCDRHSRVRARFAQIAVRWLALGQFPTSVHPMPLLGQHLGMDRLWVKRDDLSASRYGGTRPANWSFSWPPRCTPRPWA